MNKSCQNTHTHTDIITMNATSFDILKNFFLRNKFHFRLDLISDKHIFFSFSMVILFCNGSFIVYWTNDRCSHFKMFSNQSSQKKSQKNNCEEFYDGCLTVLVTIFKTFLKQNGSGKNNMLKKMHILKFTISLCSDQLFVSQLYLENVLRLKWLFHVM